MAKKKENIVDNTAAEEQAQGGGTPNRDVYSQMWGEDNDDVDFEDKEARYGRAIADRTELRERRNADSALGGLFENHNWLAVMFQELKDNPDIDPFEWLEGFCQKNDLTLQEVLDNPEARQRLTKKMTEHQKKQADDQANAQKKDENLKKSLAELEALQEEMGLDDDECLGMWGDFWGVVDQAQQGLVDKETWKAFSHSRSYDSDIQNAKDEAGMRARNEKIQNQVRRPSGEGAGLPPTLSNGVGSPTKREPQKKSETSSFLEGLND